MATRHRHSVLPNVLRNEVEIISTPAASLMKVTPRVKMARPARNHNTDGFWAMNDLRMINLPPPDP